VVFIAEQDGDAERELKARLVKRFQSSTTLVEAFLVQARYDAGQQIKVALCLQMDKGLPDFNLVRAAAEEFAQLFSSTESMDTLFLTPVQYPQITTVAQPFYRRSSPVVV